MGDRVRMDKETIRKLMLSLREGIAIDRVEDSSTNYQIQLLTQAGWVEWNECISCKDIHLYDGLRLTWEGHEVADLLSDHYKWDEVMKRNMIDGPFSLIIEYLKDS